MSKLYIFNKLKNYLDINRYPKIDYTSGYKVVTTDFNKALKDGRITFDDGIHIQHEGNTYQGYIYIQKYGVSTYGSFPRVHLTDCQTIQRFIDKGIFKQYYQFSNSRVNDVIDRDTNEVYKDQNLQICSNCKKILIADYEDSVGFIESMGIEEDDEHDIEVDIFGYTKDWPKISKAYRKQNNYTCELCSVKMETTCDYRYMHVHHKDHDKTNNQYRNLECLCIACHAESDELHEENFEKNRLKKQLVTFLKKYNSKRIL